jgi:hypothetical protein
MLATRNLCYLDDSERDILRESDYTVSVNRSLLLRGILDGLELAGVSLVDIVLHQDSDPDPQVAIAEHIQKLLTRARGGA